MDDPSEFSLVELVQLNRHAVQVVIDTLKENSSQALLTARDRLASLEELAKRGEIKHWAIQRQLRKIWASIEAASIAPD